MQYLFLRIATLCTLILTTTIILVSCAGRVYEVIGTDMEPGFPAGQTITAIPIDPHRIARGDTIVYRLDNGDIHFKRVVGLPGDSIRVESGRVYIDNQRLDEPYLAEFEAPEQTTRDPSSAALITTTLREDEFFILGDNRQDSFDSRHHGPVTSDSIMGRVKVTFLNRLTSW